LSGSKSIKDLWNRIILGIEDVDRDIPVVLLYSIADQKLASKRTKSPNLTESNVPASAVCVLEGLIGSPLAILWPPRALVLTMIALFLLLQSERNERNDTRRGASRRQMEGDVWRIEWRGHGVPATQVVVFPIVPIDSKNVLAFLIIALNPRRPYDEDYRGFVHLLTQQVTMSELSAVILREEVQRRQQLAREETMARDRLYRELSEAETKFARFAARAPILCKISEEDWMKTRSRISFICLRKLVLRHIRSMADQALDSSSVDNLYINARR
jgi:hypothetical protein